MRRSGGRKRGVAEGEGEFILLLVIALAPVLCSAGILDPWQWARSDRIEVNIPWLPCNYLTNSSLFSSFLEINANRQLNQFSNKKRTNMTN